MIIIRETLSLLVVGAFVGLMSLVAIIMGGA
jgi:hypothetical protein